VTLEAVGCDLGGCDEAQYAFDECIDTCGEH